MSPLDEFFSLTLRANLVNKRCLNNNNNKRYLSTKHFLFLPSNILAPTLSTILVFEHLLAIIKVSRDIESQSFVFSAPSPAKHLGSYIVSLRTRASLYAVMET